MIGTITPKAKQYFTLKSMKLIFSLEVSPVLKAV